MKFETPVVEIQKFSVTDILTSSGGNDEPSWNPDPTGTTRVGYPVWEYDIPCDGTAHDNGDPSDNCVG